MKKIYIAAPLSAHTPHAITMNIRNAEYMALQVWKEHGFAFCPHMNSGNFYGAIDEDDVMSAYLDELLTCDAVWFHKNWRTSSGCQAERSLAIKANIPVFDTWEDVQRFLNTGE